MWAPSDLTTQDIRTRSGRVYQYHVLTNRIERRMECFERGANPFRFEFLDAPPIWRLGRLSVFGLEVTRVCNLRCSYCCYSGQYRDQRTHESRTMSRPDVDAVLEFIAANRDVSTPPKINFYGGEALLAFPLIQYCVDQAVKRFGVETEFLVTTNGVLLTPDKVEWLVGIPNFSVSVSLDGPSEIHNRNRKTADGLDTHDTVMRNMAQIKERWPTFYRERCQYLLTLERLDLLPRIADFWDADPVLESKPPMNIGSVAPNYGRMPLVQRPFMRKRDNLYALMDYILAHPQSGVMKTFFRRYLRQAKRRPIRPLPASGLADCCFPDSLRCFIDATGAVGICEKVCDCQRIGTVRTGLDYGDINAYRRRFDAQRRELCSGCHFLRLCQTCLTCLDLTRDEMTFHCLEERDNCALALLFLCEFSENTSLWQALA